MLNIYERLILQLLKLKLVRTFHPILLHGSNNV